MRLQIYFANMDAIDLSNIIKEELEYLQVSHKNIEIDLASAFNKERNQYNALKIFDMFGDKDELHLLIVEPDIFVPAFNYCFGVAYGNKAIVSLARLKTSFYGLDEDRFKMLERLEKEVMHELGHMLGLGHCKNRSCVMYFSNTIEDTDRKSRRYCTDCKKLLSKYRSKSQ